MEILKTNLRKCVSYAHKSYNEFYHFLWVLGISRSFNLRNLLKSPKYKKLYDLPTKAFENSPSLSLP